MAEQGVAQRGAIDGGIAGSIRVARGARQRAQMSWGNSRASASAGANSNGCPLLTNGQSDFCTFGPARYRQRLGRLARR